MTEHSSPAADRLIQITRTVTSVDLPWMALERSQLPTAVSGFELLRERVLDNQTVAKELGGQHTEESVKGRGRVDGFERAFAVPQGASTLEGEPAEVLESSTAVHLFGSPEDVTRWIDEVFVSELRKRVGTEDGKGQKLTGVELLEVSSFHDYAAGVLAVNEVAGGVLASTVVGFRLGCLLGLASVVAKVDKAHSELATELGGLLERQMVRVVLEAA